MLKDEIDKCNDQEIMEDLIKENTMSFNIISSHQLLRISYTLTLTKMKKSFLSFHVKDSLELKVLFALIYI